MSDDLKRLETEALEATAAADGVDALDEVEREHLGRKGSIKQALAGIGDLPPEERGPFGKEANRIRQAVEEALEARRAALEASGAGPGGEVFDVTLPGEPRPAGALHPLLRTWRTVVEAWARLGFETVTGPEIETEDCNFNGLNIPEGHPARDPEENLYIADDVLLRSQTSTVQIRTMQVRKPPFRVIAPGRVYRPDTKDASHYPVFHQVEGLMVGPDVTMADLKTVLLLFFRDLYGTHTDIRFRPSYFPFTEPSAEVDASCPFCAGDGCRTCAGKGWLEMGGCGVVDPNVIEWVGWDNEEVTGFAFGLGIDRITMLMHGVRDIRLLFENDVRFLESV